MHEARIAVFEGLLLGKLEKGITVIGLIEVALQVIISSKDVLHTITSSGGTH